MADGERPCLLTLTPDYPPSVGGIQLLLSRLLDRLPEWEHVVVARGPGGRVEGTRRTKLEAGFGSLIELNAQAAVLGLARKPAVILNAHVTTTPAAEVVGHLTGAPIVTYLFADEMTGRPRLTRRAMLKSAQVVAISTYTRDLALHLGADPATIHVILPGVDPPSILQPGEEPRRPTVVTVARLADRYKGHDLMLEALCEVRERIAGLRWIIVGDGPIRGELERGAAQRGLTDVVSFVGRVSDIERDSLLGEADVFAMPSRMPPGGRGGEGFGIVYLEAALHGLPVVAGNVGGAVDAVQDGVTGLLVDPTSPSAIADALFDLLADPGTARTMGEAGRAFADGFTWERMAHEVDLVLRTALERA